MCLKSNVFKIDGYLKSRLYCTTALHSFHNALGVPSFVGCDNSALMCSPGVQRNVTEGSSIELSISLLFKSGGSRGVNQTITFVILHRSDTPIFICKSQDVTGSCSVLPGTNYTDRITYSGRRFPWTDIYVSINNSVASDSGIFVVQVNSHNPNGDRTEQRFSSITISVTESEHKRITA